MKCSMFLTLKSCVNLAPAAGVPDAARSGNHALTQSFLPIDRRYTYPDKKNIRCGGSVLQFLWHFSSISARVLALSLFATAYPRWVGPVCAAHVLLMTTWILAQRVDACSTAGETLLFALVLGVVYIFSFFNAKEERTRYRT